MPYLPGATVPPSSALKALGNLRVALVVVSLIAAALVVLLLLSLVFRSSDDKVGAQACVSASPAPAAASTAEVKGCRLAVPAAKLSGTVERSVAPGVVTLSDGRVAVGFAAKPTEASGLIIDLGTLDAKAVFSEPGQSAVRNVAPVAEDPLSFAVDREDGALASPRSVDAAPRTTLGFTKDGLGRSGGGSAPETVWKVATDKITEPRSARVGATGYLVSFRRGGLGGDVLVGWLDPKLAKKSELDVLPAGVRFVGTPVVAAHSKSALIAFAGRDDENADWRVRLSRAEPSQTPRSVSDFALPPGGPGGNPAPGRRRSSPW
jgi:hypothetical protein